MNAIIIGGIIALFVIGAGVTLLKKNIQTTDPDIGDNGYGSSGGTRRTRKRGTRRNNKKA
jgi:hypothetical protein